MDLLTVTSTQWDTWIAQFFLPLARILSVLATAPVLGQSPAPVQVRIGLGLALTMVIAPVLPPTHPSVSLVSLEGVMLLLEQIGIGLILGFCLNVVFAAVTMAGDMMGLQMGLGFASFYDPAHATFRPLVGQFLTVLFTLIFLSMEGHLLVIEALADSFQQIPLDPALQFHAQGWQVGLIWAGALFVDALRLSLPVLAALLVTNLGLGVLTRAAPQLNLFAVGFPLTLAVGFIVLDFSLPVLPVLAERMIRDSIEMGLRMTTGLLH